MNEEAHVLSSGESIWVLKSVGVLVRFLNYQCMCPSCQRDVKRAAEQEETQFLTVVFKLLIAAGLLGPLFCRLAQGRAFCQ